MFTQSHFDDIAWNWRSISKMLKESERVSPKEYGEMLQKRKRKKKKMGGK